MTRAEPRFFFFLRGSAPARNEMAAPSGGWTFSPDLSPEQLDNIRGLIAANGLADGASPAPAAAAPAAALEADDEKRAAEEAFAKLLAENPGAKEVAPGVYAVQGGS